MLNLLPLQNKKKIKSEYRSRRAITLLIFGIATCVMLMIFLLPTYLLAKIRFEQAEATNISLKQKIDSQKTKETNFTPHQREMLSVLESTKGLSHPPTLLLEAIISKKGASTTISDFSVQLKGNEEEVYITGVAPTRESLIAFRQALQMDKLWSDVDLPISDLGPARNNTFSMTLTVAKE